ncbi:MAG: ATP-binding protein [Bacteroidetes bacterium]|nr:MAG: ATP-binding protein [Bacteroidota bacterium]
MVHRIITQQLLSNLKPCHVTALFGARRTGKTVIMNSLKESLKEKKILLLNGEDHDVSAMLSSQKQELLKSIIAGYDFVFIDEAQSIPNIGINLKIMVDSQRETGFFVTGSASFDLRNQIGEPLTGRSTFYYLYPFCMKEITEEFLPAVQLLPQILIYGTYPQVFTEQNLLDKRRILDGIKNGYLLKDVLQLDNLKDSVFVMNLLRLVAFQIGNDISYNEMANSLKTTVKTVQRYLDILEKSFIIFRINGFSRNLRKEISKSPRFYFWDNGIRNAVISNLNPMELRDDMGRLWENFLISERIKIQTYHQSFSNFYFWRTYDQQEIDLIEENSGRLAAFEIKWGSRKTKPPVGFKKAYPESEYKTITRENFFGFIG